MLVQDTIKTLEIPSIPKKSWDHKKPTQYMEVDLYCFICSHASRIKQSFGETFATPTCFCYGYGYPQPIVLRCVNGSSVSDLATVYIILFILLRGYTWLRVSPHCNNGKWMIGLDCLRNNKYTEENIGTPWWMKTAWTNTNHDFL